MCILICSHGAQSPCIELLNAPTERGGYKECLRLVETAFCRRVPSLFGDLTSRQSGATTTMLVIHLVAGFCDVVTFGLSDSVEEFAEPRRIDVERLAAGDPWKFDCAQDITIIFVMTDNAAFADHCAIDG